jgi:hypothetical protein
MFHVKLTDLTFYADSTMDPPKVKLRFIAWAVAVVSSHGHAHDDSVVACAAPRRAAVATRKPIDQSAAATMGMCVYNLGRIRMTSLEWSVMSPCVTFVMDATS